MTKEKLLKVIIDYKLNKIGIDEVEQSIDAYASTAKPNVSGDKLNSYHIETKDGTGSFNFFTQGNDHKEALSQLQTNSSDFKNIVKSNRDLIITVKKI